jgi:CubicO group peptidase (beta-lactamase class C family)
MKPASVVCVLLLLLSACSGDSLDTSVVSYIDSAMSTQFKPDGPGGVILVARGGRPVFRKAYGLASLELNVPMRVEDVFGIASMTKQFTAVCVLELVQQGKLSLQDDIRKYLPEYNTHGRLITVEQLLTHTNGIPNFSYRSESYRTEMLEPTREELMNVVANDSLLFEPGTDWSYNDFGYVLAAFIVERVSGMPFHDYMQKNVFDPLGMKHSYFGDREKVIPLEASPYTSSDEKTFRPEEYYSWTWNIGMGDILTTVGDMLLWDESFYTGRLVRGDLLQKALTSAVLADGRKTNYGYGWAISQTDDPQVMGHSGGIGGWRSVIARIPSQHILVVILSSKAPSSVPALGATIALKVAGKTATSPTVRTLRQDALKEYAGVYEMPHYWILNSRDITPETLYRTVTVQDSVLKLLPSGDYSTTLLNVGTDLFVAKGTSTYFRFRRDDAGNVVALESYSKPVNYGPVVTGRKTDLPIPKAKSPIALDEKSLRAFAGKYSLGGAHFTRVTVNGPNMLMEEVGELLPETPTRFFVKDADITVDFRRSPRGAVTGLVLHQVWRYEGRKVD